MRRNIKREKTKKTKKTKEKKTKKETKKEKQEKKKKENPFKKTLEDFSLLNYLRSFFLGLSFACVFRRVFPDAGAKKSSTHRSFL